MRSATGCYQSEMVLTFLIVEWQPVKEGGTGVPSMPAGLKSGPRIIHKVETGEGRMDHVALLAGQKGP